MVLRMLVRATVTLGISTWRNTVSTISHLNRQCHRRNVCPSFVHYEHQVSQNNMSRLRFAFAGPANLLALVEYFASAFLIDFSISSFHIRG